MIVASIRVYRGRRSCVICYNWYMWRHENYTSQAMKKVIAYNSDRGHAVHDLNATAKGPELNLGTNYELVEFVTE